MRIELQQAAAFLLEHDRYLVLCHDHPDGDTVGSAVALCHALRSLGKQANPACPDPFPPLFDDLLGTLPMQEFEPETLISVDLAAVGMMGKVYGPRASEFGLCIDHHPSNEGYAQNLFLNASAGANTENIAALMDELGVIWTPAMANAVYTGLVTDTGCFRYRNTSPDTLRTAARMMEYGAEVGEIINRHFLLKTPARLALEQKVMSTTEYYADGKISVSRLTLQMLKETGAQRSEADALAYLARQAVGVRVGFLLKETPEGNWKVSVRSDEHFSALDLTAVFGGGGHQAAAGCTMSGSCEEVIKQLLAEAEKML